VSGYVWDPVFRVVPANGIEEVYWLSDRLTDCGGSARIGIAWPEDQELRVDINRDLRTAFGLRSLSTARSSRWTTRHS
jgi:hypothetical protein